MNIMLVGPDRAFVAVDTVAQQSGGKGAGLVTRLGGGLVHATKIIAIPHARSVVAFNGSSMANELITGACQRTGFSDADEGAGLMPSILRGVVQRLERQGYDGTGMGVFLVGWSERSERMASHMWWSDAQGPTESHTSAPERPTERKAILIMGAAFGGACPWPDTLEGFIDATRKSVAMEHAKEDPHCVGGALIVADLTRDSITLKHCGDLGLPALPRTSVTNHGLLATW